MRYSQNNEQTTILKFFEGQIDGRYLDIGAWNGTVFSNTRALAELGWSGVAVEPAPGPFLGLLESYRKYPNVKLVQAAIVPEELGAMVFYDSGGDAISTLLDTHKQKWEAAGSKFTPFYVFPVSVGQLFDSFGFDFDFISLDVEGTNWPLFRKIPFAALPKLRLICVEYDNHADDIKKLAEPFGFKVVDANGENLILGREG